MILSKKIKKYVKEWGIRLTAKIFRLASLSYAPIGFRLKCEPTFAKQNGFSHLLQCTHWTFENVWFLQPHSLKHSLLILL